MANIAEIFENMPNRFQADKAKGVAMTVEFDLTGDGGGQWYAVIEDGNLAVEEGAADSPSATIRMDADDFKKMSSGELNAMMAFMSGKIKVEGDLNSVMKFQSLVGL